MGSNWVSNLDMLAAGGVIDFDAAAYLLDKPARFVGNPQIEGLPLESPALLPEGVKLKDLPQIDEFNSSGQKETKPSKLSNWKKLSFGALVTGLLGWGIYGLTKGKVSFSKLKSFKFGSIGSKIKNSTSGLGSKLKKGGSTVLKYIKMPFTYIASKFKK